MSGVPDGPQASALRLGRRGAFGRCQNEADSTRPLCSAIRAACVRFFAFSREQILKRVWEVNYYGSDRVVDDTLRRLRRKMPDLNIHTIYGFGYRLG